MTLDEDLKILLVAELDEDASAERISGQLDEISKLVGQKNSIRVGVELDGRNAPAQMQKLSSQLQVAANRSKLGIKFDFGTEKVEELKQALENLSIPQNTIKQFIDNIYAANAGVRSISTSFDEVRNVVTATISGLDRAGNMISQIQSARIEDDGSATIMRNVTAITTNYEELSKAEQRAAAEARKAAEENTADLNKWGQKLDSIRHAWEGINPTVKQETNITALNDKFWEISNTINALDENSGRWGKDTRSAIDAQIKSLAELAVAYRNLEKAPTELRAKDVTVIKEEQLERLNTFETKLQTSGLYTEELEKGISELRTELNGVADSKGVTAFMDKLGVLKAKADSLRATLAQTRISEELENAAQHISDTMDVTGLRVEELKQKFGTLGTPAENLRKPFEDIQARLVRIDALMQEVDNASSAKERIEAYKRLDAEIDDCNQALTLMNKLQTGDLRDTRLTESLEKAKADLDTIARQWSAFTHDDGLLKKFRELSAELEQIKATGNAVDFRKWSAQFSTLKSEIKAAGLNMRSFRDTVKDALGKVTQWASATSILFKTIQLIKTGLRTVVDLDTAMIDLKKTTEATDAQYKAFYRTANETAKELNVTTEAVISQTAEWSRLGYTLEQASELARNSAIFAAVSPEMTAEEATDGLVSILKAYDEIDENDALDGIISKINILGNRLAVTNKDLVEVMTRSSAAMKAANTSFEEAMALAVAGVEVTRDASSMGNALKTVSMRIRGLDEETEEYSEDIAALTGDIADLTKVASNNFTGVSLFEPGDPETYRSIYDILADIADIWDELTDKNQAQLLEVMFGKRQGQIGSAILSNFKSARKAMEEMANSAGSAMEEFEMVQDTVQYKLNQFKETWTGVAINLFDTDQMGAVVDFFNVLSSAIEWTTDKLGLFGTAALAVFGTQLVKSVGRPKKTGFKTVPTYALVVTLKRACGVIVP